MVPAPNLSQWDKHNLSQWDRLCFSQWDRHSASGCTKPVPQGQGKVKIEPVPVPWKGHIPTLEACPCRRTGSIPTMEPVPVQPVPTHPMGCQQSGIQGRGKFNGSNCRNKLLTNSRFVPSETRTLRKSATVHRSVTVQSTGFRHSYHPKLNWNHGWLGCKDWSKQNRNWFTRGPGLRSHASKPCGSRRVRPR